MNEEPAFPMRLYATRIDAASGSGEAASRTDSSGGGSEGNDPRDGGGGVDGGNAAGGVSWDAGGTIGVSDGCCCGGGGGGDGDTFGQMGGVDGGDAAGGVSWDAGGTIGVSDGCCCGGGGGGDGDTFGQMGGVDGGDAAGGVSWDAGGARAAPSEAIAALSSNALTTSEMISHTGRFAETSSLTDSAELERTMIGLSIAGAWTMSLKSAS